ncbi:MAG: META domain-containing protein, partial [Chloroflexi bacterium]
NFYFFMITIKMIYNKETRMYKILFSLGLCAGLLLLAGCTPQGQTVGGASRGGSLTGKVWELSQLNGKPLAPGTSISALFAAGGKVGGSAGCNQYSGTYSTAGNTITFSSPMASTMMMCEQAVMDQEAAYLNALAGAKTYSVQGDQLTLTGADKTALAVYKAGSQDLGGSSWDVTGYNNGKGAVTSVLLGTTLTATFGKDGSLTGDAGCNNYNGAYKVTGEQITIGPLVSTKKACSEPAGVMEQEMQYLAALQTAATYQIEGNTLELRTRDGALAAQFSRK